MSAPPPRAPPPRAPPMCGEGGQHTKGTCGRVRARGAACRGRVSVRTRVRPGAGAHASAMTSRMRLCRPPHTCTHVRVHALVASGTAHAGSRGCVCAHTCTPGFDTAPRTRVYATDDTTRTRLGLCLCARVRAHAGVTTRFTPRTWVYLCPCTRVRAYTHVTTGADSTHTGVLVPVSTRQGVRTGKQAVRHVHVGTGVCAHMPGCTCVFQQALQHTDGCTSARVHMLGRTCVLRNAHKCICALVHVPACAGVLQVLHHTWLYLCPCAHAQHT